MEDIKVFYIIFGGIIGWILAWIRFRIERKDKFRMAAIEKRLEAHQKAYSHCMNFIDILDSRDLEEVKKVFKSSQIFMANYSLYLEENTRGIFVEALGFITRDPAK